MSDTPTNRIKQAVNLAFPAVALIFVVWFIARHSDEFIRLVTTANLLELLLSLLLLVIFVALQGGLGTLVLRSTGCEAPLRETFPVILFSLLGKYIPGKVWVLGMRFASLSGKNATVTNIVTGSVVEHVFVVATGMLIFILTASPLGGTVAPAITVTALAGFAIFALQPRLVLALLNVLLRTFKRDPIDRWPSSGQNIAYTFYYMGTWFILGGGIYFLTTALTPSLPVSSYFPLTGAYALSVIAGFLALFAPGGIGVREGLFVIALRNYMPTVQAVYVSVASRIVFTLAELLTIGVVMGVVAILKRKGMSNRPWEQGRS